MIANLGELNTEMENLNPVNVNAANLNAIVRNTNAAMANAMSHLSDPNSPYFLHPGKGPGAVLVSTPLIETNYHLWSRTMTMALESKNKMCFLDGSLPKPNIGDPLRPLWHRNNKTVLSWLVRSLSIEIAKNVLFVKASELWLKLMQQFSQGTHTRIADLFEELYSLRLGNLTMTSIFT